MKPFEHLNARTVEEACALLKQRQGRARINAGGTDLLSVLKDRILPDDPDLLINIKTIPGLDAVRADRNSLSIGPLTTLATVAASPVVRERYTVLAEAARAVATPQIRNMGTIGGNLCQDVRCWYYRYPSSVGGPIRCLRKGSGPCLAVLGDNRYHAILEGKRCFAVCPSDTAVALAALDGEIEVASPAGGRRIAVTDFFAPLGNALRQDEMVTGIKVPGISEPSKQTFLKFTLRTPVDFALVSVAFVAAFEGDGYRNVRIALGAVAPGPVRARKAELLLKGRRIDCALAREAAELAVGDAKPMSMNAYKVEIAKALVQRAILASGSLLPPPDPLS